MRSYRDPSTPGWDYYEGLVEKMVINEKTNLVINMCHLAHFSDLSDAIYFEYYRFEPSLVRTVQTYVREKYPEYAAGKTFTVGFSNMPNIETMRDLSAKKIGTLMAMSGTVTRTTEVRPELLFASFRCQTCNMIVENI